MARERDDILSRGDHKTMVDGAAQRDLGGLASRGNHDTFVAGAADAGRFAMGSRLLGGRFEIVCQLGRGGMGVVYQAIDHSRNADVALKMVPPELRHDERAIMGIKREVNVALTLTHEHICRVYDFHEAPEAQFIAMELVDGPSLEGHLAKALQEGKSGFPLDRVSAWLRPVCRALDYAHGKQVVHRDLKPGNILVSRDGSVKVTDFGLARMIHTSMSKFSREAMSGTLLYMSPEQCIGKPADARSDVYSLGMLTYELLTGRTPFADAADIAYCQLHEDIEPIPGVPDHVNTAILAATAKKREDRPKSAGAFLNMLTEGRTGHVEIVTPAVAVTTGQPKAGDTQTLDLGGGVTLELVWIPPGTFMMGSPESEEGRRDDETLHKATLTHGFWMGKYEVTQGQWERVMGSNPSHFKGGPRRPVETVSWDDCQDFIQKLNSRERGRRFNLPTEAQWEYACRAGTTMPFHTGNSLSSDEANFDGRRPYGVGKIGVYRGKTVPVGKFGANAWGLYDMHGNVWEWCLDRLEVSAPSLSSDTRGTPMRIGYLLRGGSWYDSPDLCRSAYRHSNTPSTRDDTKGLRIVANGGGPMDDSMKSDLSN